MDPENGTDPYWEPLNDECKDWSCESPPIINGGMMDPADLVTWPRGTTINYDCGPARIDTDHSQSTFSLMCIYDASSNSYEWNSFEGYNKIPKCLLSEYLGGIKRVPGSNLRF